MDDLCRPQGRYPEIFMLKGGTWRTLRVPDLWLGGQSHPWCHKWSCLTLRKIHWKFCVDIFIKSVSRTGGQEGGTWRTLRSHYRRIGGKGPRWSCLTLRKIPWKFCVDIFIWNVSRIEGQEGGSWRTLRVPDQRLGGQGHPWCHGWCCFILREMPRKLRVDIFVRSVSGMGGQEGGYLEDVEGSWPETWRTA